MPGLKAYLEGARPQHVQVGDDAVQAGAVVGLQVGDAAGAVVRSCRRGEPQRLAEQHVDQPHLQKGEAIIAGHA